MELRGKTVLVTGAGGAVGSVVASRLAREGMKVRAMVRGPAEPLGAGIELVRADMRDRDALAAAVGASTMAVHCAACISDDLSECLATNVDGTQNLLEALVAAGSKRLVHISSISAYDFRTATTFDEECPTSTDRSDAYGYTKAEGERRVLAAQSRGLTVTILRPTVVLSTHRKSHWGPLALERARSSNEPLFPAREFPYVHVDNLAEVIVLALSQDAAAGRTYNVIDGAAPTHEFLAAVGLAIGRPVTPLPADAPLFTFPGDRIRRKLGYAPVDRWREFLRELQGQESNLRWGG